MKPLDPIKEAQAVTALKETLLALGVELEDGGLGVTEDQKLLLDSIEGETSFLEAADQIVARIQDDQALVVAIDKQIGDLQLRRQRFDKRAAVAKTLLEQAFQIADLPKIERPGATLFLSNRPPKVEVTEESEVPARFWKAGDPKLDKKGLGDDLKARRDGLDAIFKAQGEDRVNAIAAFTQRFLEGEQVKLLLTLLADREGAETEEERRAAEASLRRDFGSVPGAYLADAAPTLTIRMA